MPQVQLSVYIDANVKQGLKTLAERRGVSMGTIVETALRPVLKRAERTVRE